MVMVGGVCINIDEYICVFRSGLEDMDLNASFVEGGCNRLGGREDSGNGEEGDCVVCNIGGVVVLLAGL